MAIMTGEDAIRTAREIENGYSDIIRTGIPYTGLARDLVIALLSEVDRLTVVNDELRRSPHPVPSTKET